MIKAIDLIDNKDDYAHRLCDIYKASFTDYSDLYIAREQIWITPGRIARMENNYYNDVQLGRGFVSIELQEYYESNFFNGKGWKYGTKYSSSLLNNCFLEP